MVQLSHLAVWGSIASWFLFLAIYPYMWPNVDLAPEMVGMVRAINCFRRHLQYLFCQLASTPLASLFSSVCLLIIFFDLFCLVIGHMYPVLG